MQYLYSIVMFNIITFRNKDKMFTKVMGKNITLGTVMMIIGSN